MEVSSESAKTLDRRGEAYARRGFYCCDGAVCGRRGLVRAWLRKVKVGVPGMNAANAILLVICALLCGYLLYALLKAEKF
jgi:K+-transporting ATPase KdpF subunit